MDYFQVMTLDKIKILTNGIGRRYPAVPVRSLRVFERRQDRDAAIATDHIPGRAQADRVDKEGVIAVLTEDCSPFQTGIHQVAQRGINYPGKTAKEQKGTADLGR